MAPAAGRPVALALSRWCSQASQSLPRHSLHSPSASSTIIHRPSVTISRLSRNKFFHTRSSRLLDSTPPNAPHGSSASVPPPVAPGAGAAAPATEETIVISARRQRARRPVRVYLYAAGFLILGLGMGQFMRAIVVPPPLPEPETAEDAVYVARIRRDIDALPLVQELRARRDTWVEYEAHMTAGEAERASHMVAGALAGARAVAVQRVFWNKAEHRLVTIVFCGGAVTGWPGVTHGGAVATLLQENLERVANGPEVFPDHSEQRGHHWVNGFAVNYRKPSQAHRVYVIRAELDEEHKESEHVRVKATMEDAVSGLVTADATGYCSAGPVKWTKEEAVSLWSNLTRLIS